MKISFLSEIFKIKTYWEQKKVSLQEIDKKYKNFTGQIIIISDCHLPFIDEVFVDVLKYIKQKKPKLLVINGDFVDLEYFSRFLMLSEPVDVRKEVEFADKILKELSKYCGDIIYLLGNHETRFKKFLVRKLDTKTAIILEDLGVSLGSFYSSKNIKFVDNWFVKIGDCIVCHPEAQSLVRGRVSDWTIEYFDIRIPEAKYFIIGHTHKQSMIYRRKKLAIEAGCLCRTLSYTLNSNYTQYRKELQYLGYAELYMNNGKTVNNSLRFITLKVEDTIL